MTTRPKHSTRARRPRLPVNLRDPGRSWLLSLESSTQARFYENSDWHTAIAAAYCLNVARDPDTPDASKEKHYREWRLLATALLATESARRAVHLDDEPGPPPPPPGESAAPQHRARVAGNAHVQ